MLAAMLRALIERTIPATASLSASSPSEEGPSPLGAYHRCRGDRLHMAYTFVLLQRADLAPTLSAHYATLVGCRDADGWTCWSFSQPRRAAHGQPLVRRRQADRSSPGCCWPCC